MSDELTKRIADKLSRVGDDVTDIKVELVEIRKDLNYHIKRSDTLEEVVQPIHDFIAATKLIAKIVGFIALLAGIAEGVVAVLEHLNVK